MSGAITFVVSLPIYLATSSLIVASEESGHYVEWSNITVLAVAFAFALAVQWGGHIRSRHGGLACAPRPDRLRVDAWPPAADIVGLAFSQSLRPIRDLAEGTERVAAGDYSQRLPVVQDDDLGALSASFNRMQAGLAERQRLQSHSAPTSTRLWRRGYWSRVMTSSPGNAARSR